ncbi:MAG: transcriptional regulator with XRE-family HTH domain [Pseudohongiellaceae bacterium]|jgi:transcriptional regulator with XRE-family HTH domain
MKVNAELILILREEKSWSQDELAIASGLNLRTIQRIESEATISLQSKKAIASAFDIDVRDLDKKEQPKMKKFEYKTIDLPFKFGIFKQGTPDIEEALNIEGADGWRLHQMVLPASSNMGQSERMIAIFERELVS